MKRFGWAAFFVAALFLHQDMWWWNSPELVWPGLPIGLAYHVLYCLALTVALLFLVTRRPPQEPTA